MIIPSKHFNREASKLVAEINALVPRRDFAAGGIIRSASTVVLDEGEQLVRLGTDGHVKPVRRGCQHADPQPVELITGEVVAAVCPACLKVLPATSVGSNWTP